MALAESLSIATFASIFINIMDTQTEKTEEVKNTEAEASVETSNNQPEEIIEKLNREVSELQDKYLRNVAEFDNFRRRTAKERLELIQTAGKDVIFSLLEVLDNMDRAEKLWANEESKKAENEGTMLVFNMLRSILQQKGLSAMQSIGTDFDLEKHEAITELEVEDAKKGKVIDELVKGYYLNDKLIRFAKVVVGK